MKFHQLAVGTRFRFAGKGCIKTNSVMASEVESGKPVFMKRSSEVELEDPVAEQQAAQQQAAQDQARQCLNDALIAYRQSCLEFIRHEFPEVEEQRISQLNEKLEQARIQVFQHYSQRK